MALVHQDPYVEGKMLGERLRAHMGNVGRWLQLGLMQVTYMGNMWDAHYAFHEATKEFVLAAILAEAATP